MSSRVSRSPFVRPGADHPLGRFPVSDVFSLWALKTTVEMLPRVLKGEDDAEARKQMLLASTVSWGFFSSAYPLGLTHLIWSLSSLVSGSEPRVFIFVTL